MLNCPECGREMVWVGDSDMEEDVFSTLMTCRDCHIEVVKYWGDGVEEKGY